MKKLRLGYVGCGFMAQKVHLPNFAAHPNVELVALAEVRPKLRSKVAARYNIPQHFATHEDLARLRELDAVGVSAAFSAQSDIARDLLRAGKHVFMEKPMACSVAKAEEMLAAAKQGGGRLMIAYMKRYDAGNERAKTAIDAFRSSGELGPITFARAHGFCGDWIQNLDTPLDLTDEKYPPSPLHGPSWMPEKFWGAHANYLQQYTHNLNLLRWFLNGDASQCNVRAVDFDEDGVTGIVALDIGGVRAVIESGSLSASFWDEHTQVYFRDGWVHVHAPALMHKNKPAEVEIYRAGKIQSIERPLAQPPWSWSYRREADHFVQCCLDGLPFRSCGEDTLTDVKLFEEIYGVWLKQRGII